ncbi:MAG: DUF4250 domain-containing protein [Clostridiales bacterium]|jgi:hypothetical protein|nr:DUF4250 domain-containing protein [Clostridiales bacterium]MDU6973742.1 DUF4250 domain-containing protein [Clostridiales bacterium]
MENLNRKDPYMMLSIVNMKLRDECDSLETLCKDYDLDMEELLGRMDAIGYTYSMANNQFIG